MLRSFRLLLPFLCLALLSSCFEDKEQKEITLPSPIVKSIVLGNLKRVVKGKTASGSDTTLISHLFAAGIPMYIDQLNNRIYNADSLPVGTRTDKTLFTSFLADGIVTMKKWAEEGDTVFTTTDSIDLSRPRILRVHKADFSQKRSYRLELLVHKEDPDSTTWTAHRAPALAELTVCRAFATTDSLTLFATAGSQPVVLKATPHAPTHWQRHSPSTASIKMQSVQRLGQSYFALSDSSLLQSTNGITWSVVAANILPEKLLIGGEKRLIAWYQNTLYGSNDGKLWEAEPIQQSEGLLPTTDLAGAAFPVKTDSLLTDYFLIGKAGDERVTWKRTLDHAHGEQFSWVYYPALTGGQESYALPNLNTPTLLPYGGGSLLVGMAEGRPAPLYYSTDNGRVWRKNTIPTPALEGGSIAAAVSQKQGLIWLFLGESGQVWTGRLHKVSWQSHPTAFTQ